MNALLLFTRHLKGVCTNTRYIEHYVKMCHTVFKNCETVMVTYKSVYGTASINKHKHFTNPDHYVCKNRLKKLFPNITINVVNETKNNKTSGVMYTKRYAQMISSIEKGYKLVSRPSDIIIRMRPDSGIPGINGIWSLSTWKTLLRIPENTIVQYGTFKKNNKKYLNGDNCFAARHGTFSKFVSHWMNEFEQDYIFQVKNKSVINVELVMNTVAKRHNIVL